jgi:hypothetical protein
VAVNEAESGEADTQPEDPTRDPELKNLSLTCSLNPGDFTGVDTAVGDNTNREEAVHQGDKESIRAMGGGYEVSLIKIKFLPEPARSHNNPG